MSESVIELATRPDLDCRVRSTAQRIFDEAERLPAESIVVDFRDVSFLASFVAVEYLQRKVTCRKVVREVNLSEDVTRMFEVAQKRLAGTAHHPSVAETSTPITL